MSLLSWFTSRFQSRSPQWKSVREDHIRHQPHCQACGRAKNLDVHHIVPVSVDPDLELDPTNLITLCGSPCHLVHGHLMSWRRWNPSVVADCGNYYLKLRASENR